MVTAEIFDNLKKLQDILVEKYALEAKVKEAPDQLKTQEEFLTKLKTEFIEKKNKYDETSDKVSKLKFELDEAVKSRESGEKGMDSITTHREYEALEKQINEATEKENEVRKELQKEEKILAELNESLKSKESLITAQESDLNASKDSLNGQIADYNKQLEGLQKREDEIAPNLDQEILFKFERIIQRNSEGIVAVKNGVCTGCHMILPADFANEVREGDSVKFCPYCSRILFYEEVSEDEAEDFTAIGAAGTLGGLDDDEDDEDENEDLNQDEFDDEDADSDVDGDSEEDDDEDDAEDGDESEDSDSDE